MCDEAKEYAELVNMISNILDSPSKGGNISIKEENLMYIKPSGVDYKSEKKYMTTKIIDADISSCMLKPSMEWKFHQHIKYKYIVHYHPLYILKFLCSDIPMKNINKSLMIDYYMPGECLFNYLKNIDFDLYEIIFMKNHGVILYSNNLQHIKFLYNKLKTAFYAELLDNIYLTPDSYILKDDCETIIFNLALKYLINDRYESLDSNSLNELENNSEEKYRKS